jgi:hypothetical protein
VLSNMYILIHLLPEPSYLQILQIDQILQKVGYENEGGKALFVYLIFFCIIQSVFIFNMVSHLVRNQFVTLNLLAQQFQ